MIEKVPRAHGSDRRWREQYPTDTVTSTILQNVAWRSPPTRGGPLLTVEGAVCPHHYPPGHRQVRDSRYFGAVPRARRLRSAGPRNPLSPRCGSAARRRHTIACGSPVPPRAETHGASAQDVLASVCRSIPSSPVARCSHPAPPYHTMIVGGAVTAPYPGLHERRG